MEMDSFSARADNKNDDFIPKLSLRIVVVWCSLNQAEKSQAIAGDSCLQHAHCFRSGFCSVVTITIAVTATATLVATTNTTFLAKLATSI